MMHEMEKLPEIETMPEAEIRPRLSHCVRTLALWTVCVLFFEIGLIAIAPRFHASSVLKLAKSTVAMHIVFNDFSPYLSQAELALHQAPQALYETVFFQRGVRFIYPPTALLLYRAWMSAARFGIRPLFAMNLTLWVALWTTFAVAARFFLDILSAASEPAPSPRDRWLARFLVALLGLTFLPLVNAYCLGQVQTLLNLALIASVFLWMRGGRVAPGLLLGLTCFLKPQMALFLLWGIFRRQWSFAISLTCMLLTAVGLSIAVFGWHNSVEYLSVLRYLSLHGDALATNQSLNGLLHRLFHVGHFDTARYGYPPYSAPIYWLTFCGSSFLLLAALIVPPLQRISSSTVDLLLFAMATTMASPIAWEHHYGVFFLAFLAWIPRAAKSWRIFLPLLGMYLLMADAWAPMKPLMFTPWTFLLSHVFYGGFFLFLWTLLAGKVLLPLLPNTRKL